MTELAWGWAEIAVVLMWRLAPAGVVITRRDLVLPVDRVLFEDRRPDCIKLRFIPLEEAEAAHAPLPGLAPPATVEPMAGRWQKIAVVLLWKLAKGGVTLTEADRTAVPADRVLLAHGHAQDIEYRFAPRAEAEAIAKQEREQEGRIILERPN